MASLSAPSSIARAADIPVLQARNVTLRFGGVTAWLTSASKFVTTELLAIIGPNGAGKSSLMNVLSGFYQPQQGDVRTTVRTTSRAARCTKSRATAWCALFRGTHLFSNMSVLDNILVGRYCKMRSSLAQAFLYFPWTQREETLHREAESKEIIDFLEI